MRLISLCVLVNAASNYGEYHLFKNTGGVFYDYSGNKYHAINGSTVQVDSNDITSTDRGAYFNGVSSYIQIHNSQWKSLTLPDNWSSTAWVYPMERNAYMSRWRVDVATPELKFKYIFAAGDNLSVTAYLCSGGTCGHEVHTTATGLIDLNNWYILPVRLFKAGSNGRVSMDRFSDTSGQISTGGLYTEDSAHEHITYLGTDFSTYYKGFVYQIRFKPGSTSRTELYHTSGCPTACYSFSDPTYCTCSQCTKTPGKYCISSCIDLTTSADCVSCSTCDGICSVGDSCLECPQNEYPSCDGTALNNDLCHSDCLSCETPLDTGCIICFLTYAHIDSVSSKCVCPTLATKGATACECPSGYIMVFDGTQYNCEACVSPCSLCSGTVNYCTECDYSYAEISSGVCSCPSNSQKVSNACECSQGFYDSCTGSCSNTIVCSACDSDCTSCSGGLDTQCITCALINANIDSSSSLCQCPSFSSDVSGTCECSTGRFMDFDGTSYSCESCHPECATCTGSLNTNCLTCSYTNANFDSSTNSCSCPSGSSEVLGACDCGSGNVMLFDGSDYYCQACLSPCSECSGSTSFCTACDYSYAEISSGVCSCPSNSQKVSNACECSQGFYDSCTGSCSNTIVCSACDSDCASCSGGLNTQCITCVLINANIDSSSSLCQCPSFSSDVSGTCECSAERFMDFDGTSYSCESCHPECATCTGSLNTNCLTCSYTNANFDSSTNSCSCPSGSSEVLGTCDCGSGNVMLFDGSDYYCQACEFPCTECSGSIDYCTVCAYSNSVIDSTGTCMCPNNASLIVSDCICDWGFYKTCSGCNSCSGCKEECSSCENGTECLTCKIGMLTPSFGCISCEAGYYISSSYACEPCHEDCADCLSATQCVTCKGLNRIPWTDGSCIIDCEDGYYASNEECVECKSTCQSCLSYENCISCVPGAEKQGNTCECLENYIESNIGCWVKNFTASMEIDKNNQVFLSFSEDLKSYLTRSDIEIRIEKNPSFSWEFEAAQISNLEINLSFEDSIEEGDILTLEFLSEIRSAKEGYLSTKELQGDLHEFIYKETWQDTQELVLPLITSIVITSSILSGNYFMIWNFINTIEILMFIPLSNNPLTDRLFNFLVALNEYNFLPSILDLFLEDHGSKPYKEAYNYGFATNDYLLNSGFFCIAHMLILVLTWFQWYGRYDWFTKMYKIFHYSVFIRWSISAYLELIINALIQVENVTIT